VVPRGAGEGSGEEAHRGAAGARGGKVVREWGEGKGGEGEGARIAPYVDTIKNKAPLLRGRGAMGDMSLIGG